MSTCASFESLIAERAAGAIGPADAAMLDAHLAACDHCRAELAAYERALGLAKLPPPTDAERAALSHLPTRVRADLDRAPIGKFLGRILGLAAVAATIVVVIANKVVLPGAQRRQVEAAAVAAKWEVPDPDALFAKVERQYPDLAIHNGTELSRAEQLADAAYLKVMAEE